jgi:two-component system sensor histidine kinase HydH
MPIGLVAINDREEIISFNQTAESVLGYLHADVLGKNAEQIIPPPCMALLQGMKAEKKVVEKEIACPLADGRTIFLEVIATVLEEDNGNFLGYVILFRDITEVQHLKKEMERSQRLASVGSLAAGIAHEIRNPLSSIKGFATFFKERYRDNPEDQKTADIMVQEVERLNRVIGQLLEFARPMEMERQWTSIQDVIRHTLKMIEGQAKAKNVAAHMDLPGHLGEIFIDRDKITQVLLNLYLNGIEAMEEGGALTVTVLPHEGRMVRIDVSDTGKGIDEKDIARIFDPYFTTRSSGTGIGLAIVHKIIESHDGELRVTSEPGKGTTVSIFLPTGAPSVTNE